MKTLPLLALLAVVLMPPPAFALPRFAARNSLRCRQCHVNPSGGGVRNRYGAEVFELTFEGETPEVWTEVPAEEPAMARFGGTLTEWLWIGADLRAAFFLEAPQSDPETLPNPRINTTFFLMQADLYHAARLGRHTTLVLDIGVNAGFEAWALLTPWPDLEDLELLIKIGRFTPALGIRTANHSLYTRQNVGLGAAQQDTGLELTLDGRYAALTLGLTNGAVGGRFDGTSEARGFDKAFAARGSFRWAAGSGGVELGGYASYNSNTTESAEIFNTDETGNTAGVDELRAGGFLVAGLGRFAFLADFLVVQDNFREDGLDTLAGYAGYGELSMRVVRGFEVIAGFERQDANLDASSDERQRWSLATELFVWRHTELRVMGRYEHGSALPAPVLDLVAYVHLYL